MNNTNIIFLSGLFPKEKYDYILNNSKGVIQNAADNLQWSIVKGLDRNNVKLTLVNLPYIGSFPKRFKKIYSNNYHFSHNSIDTDYNIGFVNLPLYKSFSRYINAKKALNKLASSTEDNVVILIYGMHTPFIEAAVAVKKNNPKLKIVLIVPDLPEYMGEDNSIIKNIFKKIDTHYIYKAIEEIDGFVILTEFMKESLNIQNKPYTVLEGIFDNYLDINDIEKEKQFTVLYTGTLAKRYGIVTLIDSFLKIDDPSFRLWICGDGDGKDDLINAMKIDKRIKYWGQLPYNKILELQKKASLLVNPREPEDFTKYSFPSKTMEYLASATPTLLYKLQGIPEEYYQYCFAVEGKGSDALKNKILEVSKLSQNEKDVIGHNAKSFIFTKKSPEIQTLKIINLIHKLFYDANQK